MAERLKRLEWQPEIPGLETHGQNILILKAVVILFPDVRTTSDDSLPQDYVPILFQNFRDTTDRLLARYQRLGFRTSAVIYEDTNSETFSYLYPRNQFQNIIRWKAFGNWGNDEKFRQFYESGLPVILKELNLREKAEVVVGGYHAKDCVAAFAGYLKKEGFRTKVDLRLTDELPFLLISHRLRRMLPKEMRKEHARVDRLTWEHLKQEEEKIIEKQ